MIVAFGWSFGNGFDLWKMFFKEHENNKLLQIKRRFSRIDLFFEEGVCRWHMTDEKRNIDHKDIQIVQVIF